MKLVKLNKFSLLLFKIDHKVWKFIFVNGMLEILISGLTVQNANQVRQMCYLPKAVHVYRDCQDKQYLNMINIKKEVRCYLRHSRYQLSNFHVPKLAHNFAQQRCGNADTQSLPFLLRLT